MRQGQDKKEKKTLKIQILDHESQQKIVWSSCVYSYRYAMHSTWL